MPLGTITDTAFTGERKPRLLDLFCCAGGAGMGYHRAGFEVVGVDIKPQPRYPFEFIQADCLSLDPAFVASFDAIHASPPCQGYSDLRHAPGAKGAPRLIGAVREKLKASKRPYVIENVVGARKEMRDPVVLCGSAFGLGAQGCDLERHRLFETSFALDPQQCARSGRPVIGVYGGHARKRSAKHGGRGTRDVWEGGHRAAAAEAMGIDWMTLAELSEAIPPAYTQWIGERLMALASLHDFTGKARPLQAGERGQISATKERAGLAPSSHQSREDRACGLGASSVSLLHSNPNNLGSQPDHG